MARIIIPTVLRSFTDRTSELFFDVPTVTGIIDSLIAAYPALGPHILDDKGQLRSSVNMYVNNADIRTLQGTDTVLAEDSTVLFIPSNAGGW